MTKQPQKFVLSEVTPLLLFVLVGFTVGPSSPRLGTYTMSIAAEGIPSNVPAEVRSNFVGKWEMTFAKENKYQVSKDGRVLVEGRFTSAKEQLTLTDEKGVLACTQQPGMETGTYKWSYKQKKLTFTAVEEKCEGRRFVLTLHSWLKGK